MLNIGVFKISQGGVLYDISSTCACAITLRGPILFLSQPCRAKHQFAIILKSNILSGSAPNSKTYILNPTKMNYLFLIATNIIKSCYSPFLFFSFYTFFKESINMYLHLQIYLYSRVGSDKYLPEYCSSR